MLRQEISDNDEFISPGDSETASDGVNSHNLVKHLTDTTDQEESDKEYDPDIDIVIDVATGN